VDASGEWLISSILANESGPSDLAAEPLEELV